MKLILFSAILLLTACGDTVRTPTTSGDPRQLGDQTLCFRYANSRDAALAMEIDARALDCAGLLRDDPLYHSGPDESVYRIGR